jgi:hypothetical protein
MWRVDGEDRPVELDREVAPSATGVEESLQRIALGYDFGLVLAGDVDPASLPEPVPPAAVLVAGLGQGRLVGGVGLSEQGGGPLIKGVALLCQRMDSEVCFANGADGHRRRT